jgi:hypothetical protein
VLFVFDDAEMSRHRRNLGLGGGLLGFDLVAHRGDGARIRADEDDARLGQLARKRLALGQEAIAGMHRLRAGLAAGLDDLVDQQITLGRGRRADQHGGVGHFDMKCIAVGLGIYGHRLDPHPARSLDDPAGDLAAICDQNSLEHVLLAWALGGILTRNVTCGDAGNKPVVQQKSMEATVSCQPRRGRRRNSPGIGVESSPRISMGYRLHQLADLRFQIFIGHDQRADGRPQIAAADENGLIHSRFQLVTLFGFRL